MQVNFGKVLQLGKQGAAETAEDLISGVKEVLRMYMTDEQCNTCISQILLEGKNKLIAKGIIIDE